MKRKEKQFVSFNVRPENTHAQLPHFITHIYIFLCIQLNSTEITYKITRITYISNEFCW